jgi:hypothetical protein
MTCNGSIRASCLTFLILVLLAAAGQAGASLPSQIPTNALNVRDEYGTSDASIRRAISVARSRDVALYFPAGRYTFDSYLILDGVSAFGDGNTSVLEATNPASSAIILRGSHVTIESLKVTSPRASERMGSGEAAGVYVDGASDFLVARVTVDRAQNTGILVSGAAKGRLTSNSVRGTMADSIHITGASHDLVVRNNRVTNSGDDMIAVVSYLDAPPCSRITISGNVVRGQRWGRGISVVGGRRITVARNTVRDTSGAGVLINADGRYGTHGTADVRVVDNRISNTDRNDIHHGGIHLQGQPDQFVTATVVSGNVVSDAGYGGIVVEDNTDATVIRENRIMKTAEHGIFIEGGDVVVQSNRIESTATYGIYVTRVAAGMLTVADNVLRESNMARLPSVDVIHVESGSALLRGEILRNTYASPEGSYDRFIESDNSQVIVSENRDMCMQAAGAPCARAASPST